MEKKYELTERKITTTNNMGAIGKYVYQIKALKDFGDVKKGEVGGYIESEDNLSQEGNCWVFDDAIVFDDARVYEDATVCDSAVVYGKAKIRDRAKVYDGAKVCDCAIVEDEAEAFSECRIYGNATVGGKAEIFENAKIYGNARVRDSATVYGNARIYADTLISSKAVISGYTEVFGVTEITQEIKISENAIISSNNDIFTFARGGDERKTVVAFKTATGYMVRFWQFVGNIDEFMLHIKEEYGEDNKHYREYKAVAEAIRVCFEDEKPDEGGTNE